MNAARTLLLLMLPTICLAVGCGGSPKDRLVGKWIGKAELAKPQGGEGAGAGLARQFAQAMVWQVSLQLDLRADGTMSIGVKAPVGNQETQGTWELVAAEGDKLTISSKETDGNPREITFTFNNENEMVMEPLAGTISEKLGRIVFTRQMEE